MQIVSKIIALVLGLLVIGAGARGILADIHIVTLMKVLNDAQKASPELFQASYDLAKWGVVLNWGAIVGGILLTARTLWQKS